MKKLFDAFKYFSYGLQFTAIVIAPFIVCILLGGYIQRKYALGDWVILVSIVVAVVLMISDMVSFGKTMLRKMDKESRRGNNDKQNDKK